ncbi:MAG: DNA-3-methyladenine glycosylase 2 [Acidimicrobiales bacterium]
MASHHMEIEAIPPFRLDLTVWALRRREHNSIDTFDGTTYRRTLAAAGQVIEVAVSQAPGDEPSRPVLSLELRRRRGEPSRAAVAEAARFVACMLGLDVDLAGFYSLAASDDRLDRLVRRFRGVRPPRFPSVFEALVNAIACQQLSLSVGIHLLDRLASTYGAKVPGGSPAFPGPEQLAVADASQLRFLGFSQAKARSIVTLAKRVSSGAVDLEALGPLDDPAAVAALVELPGIGRWSAEYVLLRGLGRLHVLPGDDVGARNNLRRHFGLAAGAGYGEVAALAEMWRPYGGMVYFHLLLDGLASAGHPANVGSSQASR